MRGAAPIRAPISSSSRAGASAVAVSARVRGACPARCRVCASKRPANASACTTRRGRRELSRLSQIRSLVLIAAVLAMAAAMGAMIWQRRLRLADMKVDGFSRVVLWRALLWESAILLGVGLRAGRGFRALRPTRAEQGAVAGHRLSGDRTIAAPCGRRELCADHRVAVAIVAVPGYAAARVRPDQSVCRSRNDCKKRSTEPLTTIRENSDPWIDARPATTLSAAGLGPSRSRLQAAALGPARPRRARSGPGGSAR